MREAVIVSTARTPITKAQRGEFNLIAGPTWRRTPCAPRWNAPAWTRPDRGRADRLRLSRGRHRPQHRPPGRDPRRAACVRGRRHHQPLLRLGPAGHRFGGRAHRDGRRAGHDRRRRRMRFADPHPRRRRQRSGSVAAGAQARAVPAHDRDRRHRRRPLRHQPRGAGPLRGAKPAAHRGGPGRRPLSGRDHSGHHGHGRDRPRHRSRQRARSHRGPRHLQPPGTTTTRR